MVKCKKERNMDNLITKTRKKSRAQKHVPIEVIIERNFQANPVITDEEYDEYLNNSNGKNKGRTRLDRKLRNLNQGRKIHPCGKECHAWGKMVIESHNHESMKKAKYLMNDIDFLLEMSGITRSPRECDNFFYAYVDPHLKSNADFRLAFLKALYLNQNLFTKEDIDYFVKKFHFENENKILTISEDFYNEVKQNFSMFYPVPEKKWNNIEEKKAIKRFIKVAEGMNDECEVRLLSLLSSFKCHTFKLENSNNSESGVYEANNVWNFEDKASQCDSDNDDSDDDLKDFYIPDDGSWRF